MECRCVCVSQGSCVFKRECGLCVKVREKQHTAGTQEYLDTLTLTHISD